MAKKVTTTPKKVVNKNVEVENVVEVDSLPTPSIEEIKESMDSVNMEMPENTDLKKIEEQIVESLAPIAELAEEVNEIAKTTDELNVEITNSPEAAETYIEEAIKKAENVQNKINKAINNSSVTNWWNGMGYDF